MLSPTTTEQVRRAVECATRTKSSIAVKSGGHNYAGFSQAPPTGFQLNLQSMCTITNATTEFGEPAIRFTAGCVFANLYGWLQSMWPSKLLSGGFCPTVGASGFYHGGGVGSLSRQYGMGMDQLLSATVVLANGSAVVTASPTVNADLFWGIGGGGGGSLGVVTEWAVKVHPAFGLYSYGEFCPSDSIASYRAALLQLSAVIDTLPTWLTLQSLAGKWAPGEPA